MTVFFDDRHDAGRRLAKKLAGWVERNDVIVLALPRGGVPVAYEIALHLHAQLDLILVRKLGVPGHEELALGAIAMPGVCVFNREVVLGSGVSQREIDVIVDREGKELQRRNKIYRGGEPAPDLKNKVVIVVDDGVATGATMRAAMNTVAQQQPLHTIIAVPVAPEDAFESLKHMADEVVCLQKPESFFGVGGFYRNFEQTTDEEVQKLLEQSKHWGKASVDFMAERKHA